MTELPVCERCGLRVVRHELERQGVIMRFCDECYWGEPEGGAPPEVPTPPGEPGPLKPGPST